MKAIDDGWEELRVFSYSKIFSPRVDVLMAGLSCDELVIIGGNEKYADSDRGDGYILDIPKMRLRTVIKNKKANIKFSSYEC